MLVFSMFSSLVPAENVKKAWAVKTNECTVPEDMLRVLLEETRFVALVSLLDVVDALKDL